MTQTQKFYCEFQQDAVTAKVFHRERFGIFPGYN